jgi:glutamine synthetase
MRDDTHPPGKNPNSDEYDYATGKAAASDSILREARDAGVRLVRCLWADLSNIIRGRAIHVDALRQHVINGIGIPASSMGLTITDLQAAPHLKGQVRLLPDPRTFRVVQYAPNTAVMLGELYETDLQPWALCPRTFLKRMLADMTDLGLHMQVGFEIEFYFGVRASDGSFVPVDESLYSSSVGMAVAGKVINDIVGSLDEQHVAIDHYHPEGGHGQQELVLRAADPLTACDRVLLARETIRSIAWSHGWYASFTARPFEAQPPSGLHAHLSLFDRYEQNVLYKPGDKTAEGRYAPEISEQASRFMAGLLHHLPALTALTCPTVNSYRRLQAQSPIAPFVAWGYDNRQAMLRLVPLTWQEGDAAANMELKLADGSANPYLMLGGLIAAGMDGLSDDYGLMQPVQSSPAQMDPALRESLGIEPLPAHLLAACETLERDDVLAAAMGSLMLDTFLAIKRQEVKTFEGSTAATEQVRHYWKF